MSSVTISVRIPRRLAERMKRHREVNWSEVIRRSIEEYLEKLEEAETVEPPARLLERLHELGLGDEDLEPLPPGREEGLQERMRELEWSRLRSTTRAQ